MPEYPIETRRFYRGFEVPAMHVRNRHASAFADGVDAVLNEVGDEQAEPKMSKVKYVEFGDPEPDRSQPAFDNEFDRWEYEPGAGWCWCSRPRAHGRSWSEMESDLFPFQVVTD